MTVSAFYRVWAGLSRSARCPKVRCRAPILWAIKDDGKKVALEHTALSLRTDIDPVTRAKYLIYGADALHWTHCRAAARKAVVDKSTR